MQRDRAIPTFLLQLLKVGISSIIIVMCGRVLGAGGRGEIATFLFYAAILNSISEFIGGSSIANLSKTYSLPQLLPAAYLWAVIISLGGFIFFQFYLEFAVNIILFLFTLSINFLSIHSSIYQGLGLVRKRTEQSVIAEIFKLFLVLILIFGFTFSAEQLFTIILFILMLVNLIYAVYTTLDLKILKVLGTQKLEIIPMRAMTAGIWSQSGHLVQAFNYRTGLLVLEKLVSPSAAGIFSNLLLLNESVWLYPNVLGSIAHARILNSKNAQYQQNLVVRYTIYAILATIAISLIALIIPGNWYTGIFGDDFYLLKNCFIWSLPAVFALSMSACMSNYIHGINQFKYLFFSNLTGLIIQLTLLFIVFQEYSLFNTIMAYNAGFVGILIMLLFRFRQHKNNVTYNFILSIRGLRKILKRIIR